MAAEAGERSLGLLSVVAPMYNEGPSAAAFVDRLSAALEGLNWELIAVDDGSVDDTRDILNGLADADPRIKVIRLSRNFGHQAAITAGLDRATGDAVVTIDADLQDPPEVIPQMVDEWRRGIAVVHGVRERRPGEPRWRLRMIKSFYRLFGRMARLETVGNSGDFRLIDRRAVGVLAQMPERNRFLRGMSVWVGFEQSTVTYDRDARYAGETKYPLHKLVELAFDGIASFSYLPLRAAAILGLIVSVLALGAIPFVIAWKIAGNYIPGIASITIVMLLLGGIQLLTIGVMGEYLGRSYEELKRRPIYVVSDTRNLPPEGSGDVRDRRLD